MKNHVIIIFTVLIFGPIAALIPGKITISKTGSVDPKVFWSLSPDKNKINTDTYIRANQDIHIPGYDCSPCSIVKRVGCLPGQHLRNAGRNFYCNDRLLGQALKGKNHYIFNGTIPEGRYFIIGDSEKSYDSRYFGLIEEEKIDAVLIPII